MRGTSFKAGDWGRYLHTSCQKAWKGRESKEKERPDSCCGGKEDGFPPVDDHAEELVIIQAVWRMALRGGQLQKVRSGGEGFAEAV